jgi:hypothetical protein
MGLRPFVDVAAVLQRHGGRLDWPTLCARAGEWGWTRGVYLTLALASELVGAAVPDEVLRRLRRDEKTSEVTPADEKDLEGLFDQARSHIFSLVGLRHEMAPAMSRLVSGEPLPTRLRHFRDRVLLPRPMLASIYGLPLDAPGHVYVLHDVRRLFDLLGRYAWTAAVLLFARRSPARRAADRQNAIGEWLNGG